MDQDNHNHTTCTGGCEKQPPSVHDHDKEAKRIDVESAIFNLLNEAVSISQNPNPQTVLTLIAQKINSTLNSSLCLIGELSADSTSIRVIGSATSLDAKCPTEYNLKGTPCQNVVSSKAPCFHTEEVANEFPDDLFLANYGIVAYAGTPILDYDGNVIGIIAVLFQSEIESPALISNCVSIFSNLAALNVVQQRTLRELADRKAMLQSLFDQNPLRLAILDTNGVFLEINDIYKNYQPLQTAQILGVHAWEHPFALFKQSNADFLKNSFADILRGTPKAEAILPIPPGGDLSQPYDKSTCDYSEITLAPILNANKDIVYISMSAKDVTASVREREEQDKRLHLDDTLAFVAANFLDSTESREPLSNVSDALHALRSYYEIDTIAFIQVVNNEKMVIQSLASKDHNLDKLCGYEVYSSQDRFVNNRISTASAEPALYHVGDFSEDSAVLPFMEKGGFNGLLTVPIIASGSVAGIIMLATTDFSRLSRIFESPHKTAPLKVLSRILSGTFQRGELIDSLGRSKKSYRHLVENVPGLVYQRMIKPTTSMLYVSEESNSVLGREPDYLLSNNVSCEEIFFSEKDLSIRNKALEEALATNQPYRAEYRIKKPDGSIAWVVDRGRAVTNDGETILYGTMFDNTEQKRAEMALAALDKAKNEFIATAAHELNTPLTSIMGYTELLINADEHGGFSKEQIKEFLKEIYSRSDALSTLIASLLDINKIQRGERISINKTPNVDVCSTLKEIARESNSIYPSHQFSYDGTDCLKICHVNLDPMRFRQAIDNLISNAVKYSDKETNILLGLKLVKGECIVSVKDEGIGIPKGQLDKVFDRFYRLNTELTAVSGMGIGLDIVKDIAEGHGGRAWAESTVGAGSTFYLAFPL